MYQHVLVSFRRPESINAGYRRDNDYVPALQERSGCGMPHFVNGFVDAGVFLDVCVRLGNVRFRLVIVIIGNEILYRVFGKEAFELIEKLRCEGLVWG